MTTMLRWARQVGVLIFLATEVMFSYPLEANARGIGGIHGVFPFEANTAFMNQVGSSVQEKPRWDIGLMNISAQLPSSGIVSPTDQIANYQHEPDARENKQCLGQCDANERYLGSFVASLVCLLLGWRAGKRWDLIGPLLVLYAVAGLVGRFDLFSIFLRLF